MIKFLAAFVILGLNTYVYWFMGSEEVVPARTEFASFPDQVGDWRCHERDILDPEVIENIGLTDYISCAFVNTRDSYPVHLYVGYNETQTRDRQSGQAAVIHPPEHCLPGSGWDVIDAEIVPINISAGVSGEAKRLIIAKGNLRQLVYFWYHSRGHVIAQNHHKILWMFLDRAREGRTDGSLVRFTTQIVNGDVEAAEVRFKEMSAELTPLLATYVPD